MKPRKRISQMSSKRRAQMVVYLRERNIFLKDWPICQVCENRKAVDIHHRRPRSLFPKLICEPSNFLSVCRCCHSKITDHPAWAKENGWLVVDRIQ